MVKPDPQLSSLLRPLKVGHIDLPANVPHAAMDHRSDTFTTVRRAKHRGKQIEITTTYRILIDGEPYRSHVTVLNDGTVHTHGLPQYSFASAIAMVRKVIDTFDVALPADELGEPEPHHSDHKEH